MINKKFFITLFFTGLILAPVFSQRFIDDEDEVEDLLALEDDSYIDDHGELSDSLLTASQ